MAKSRVALVDDERWIRSLLRSIVSWKKLEAEVVGEAGDGEAALALCRLKRPQILITDVKMPGMDGLELIQRVRTEFPSIQCIVVSGYEEFDLVRRAMRLGVLDYLSKPIERDQVEAVVRRAIECLEASERLARERDGMRDRVQKVQALLTSVGGRENAYRVDDWRIERALGYIEENLARIPSLREVADACFLSPSYFSEKFKGTVGDGFSRYLAGLRARKAELLLRRNELKCREVSEMLGFSSQSYFSRFMKKAIGCTPEEFRRRLARGDVAG